MERGESAASRPASHESGGDRGSGATRSATTTLVLGGPGTGKTARVLAAAEEARTAVDASADGGKPRSAFQPGLLGERPRPTERRATGEPIIVAVSASAATTLRNRAGQPGADDPRDAAPPRQPNAPRVLTVPGVALLVLRETAPAGVRPPRLIGRSERLAMLHEFVASRDLASGAPTAADLLERIDRLAAHGIDADRVETWAAALADGPFAARQREFGALVRRHEGLLESRGLLSSPMAVLAARRALAGTELPGRFSLIAVDDAQELPPADLDLILDVARASRAPLLATADDDQSPRGGDAAAAPIRAMLQHSPDAAVVHLERSQRLKAGVAYAAELVVA
ncbi:MAG: AAA family ATPase, partial [Solirubrobacteraceae bacterium]|nr:AAA family ATPase [Solirubrobacteraceae bacterium]